MIQLWYTRRLPDTLPREDGKQGPYAPTMPVRRSAGDQRHDPLMRTPSARDERGHASSPAEVGCRFVVHPGPRRGSPAVLAAQIWTPKPPGETGRQDFQPLARRV